MTDDGTETMTKTYRTRRSVWHRHICLSAR
jgi:hypothetical protein